MRLLAALIFALTALAHPVSSTANAQGVQLMPNYIYDISVIRPDTSKDGDFTIRLASPAAMSGCFKVNPADIEIVDAGAIIFVRIEEGDIELDKKTTYGQFGCKMNAGGQHIDITFNKNKLIENNTNKIDIKSKTVGNLFDIKVEAEDNKVTLHTELKTGARLPESEKKKIIHHWFYPENTLILSASNMDKSESITKQVKNLAASRGLTPLEFILDGHKSSPKHLYYVDTKNMLNDTLDSDSTITIGHITTSETYQSANGPYEKVSKHAVFAKRPNATE